jgi:hypothetical protein
MSECKHGFRSHFNGVCFICREAELESQVTALQSKLDKGPYSRPLTAVLGEKDRQIAALQSVVANSTRNFGKSKVSVDRLKEFISRVMPQLTGKDQREARTLFELKGGEHDVD